MKAIDLFAGAGGFSEGAKAAGVQVVWAGNHWGSAVAVHEQNHPDTIHVCQDLHQANWLEVPDYDLLMASPCCQGHSRARGKDRPHHDAARSTAWAMVSAAEAQLPKAFILENVPEFLQWTLFPAWALAMEKLGYQLSHAVLDAQYFHVPQERKRIFIVGLRKKAFRFPTTQPFQDLVPVSTALDMEGGDWFPVSDRTRAAIGKTPLAANTQARIAEGRRRFGDKPFWIPYFGSNIAGYGVDRPIWCITTRDRYRLVLGDQTRILSTDECRNIMGFPADYKLTGKCKLDKHLLGNAVCPPVATWLIKQVVAAA